MNKTNFKLFINIVSIFFIFYSLLSVIRSIGLLYLTFSDTYFHNFDFDVEKFSEKINIYYRYFHYTPYALGAIFFMLFKKMFNINWGKYILIGLFGILLFRFIDAEFVRPFFAFFQNTRINTFIILFTFLIIGISFFITRDRVKGNQNK